MRAAHNVHLLFFEPSVFSHKVGGMCDSRTELYLTLGGLAISAGSALIGGAVVYFRSTHEESRRELSCDGCRWNCVTHDVTDTRTESESARADESEDEARLLRELANVKEAHENARRQNEEYRAVIKSLSTKNTRLRMQQVQRSIR
jgi:hypothetical protein